MADNTPPIEMAPIYQPTTEATEYAEIPDPEYDEPLNVATVQIHETPF